MDSIKPLMDLAGGALAAGPLGMVLWMWWQERSERRELSAQILKLAVEQIESEKEMTAAINVLTAKVVR